MERAKTVAWVMSVCTYLRLSQAKTLSELVWATLRVGRVSLAQIARSMASEVSAKHRIKRVWRFTANTRVETSDAMRGVIAGLVKRRKKPLIVAVDWVDIRGICTLVASGVFKGRSIPLAWVSHTKWEFHRSRNNLEEGLLRILRDQIPTRIRVIVLADRGFGRTEMVRVCRELEFSWVIRICPKVWVQTAGYQGDFRKYPVQKGICLLLKDVTYRKLNPVKQNLVIRWKEGLPKKRDEPWYLMTDLARSALSISELYGQRMTIEEMFRDHKSTRNGFSLRKIQVRLPDRLDRLLLILALAYILLSGLGLVALKHHRPGMWSSNNVGDSASVFTIGKAMLERLRLDPGRAFAAVAAATVLAAGKWG